MSYVDIYAAPLQLDPEERGYNIDMDDNVRRCGTLATSMTK